MQRESSVLNQFGSPSLNSNTFANRPAFGQVGRLFVDTTNNIIQRDTGSSWVTIGGSSSTPNLQAVTTVGNTTTVGIFAGASGSLTAGKLLEVKGKTLLTDTSGNVLYIGLPSITPNSATLDVYGYTSLRNTVDTAANLGPLLYAQYSLNYGGTQLSGFANSIFAQDIYNVSASTTVASSTQSGTSLAINTYKFTNAATITFTQPSGTIRAASAITAYSQFQNTAAGTITHAAGLCILGVENIGGSALNITNNYQLLINASDEFASTATITNRWGVYQGGANDNNYFAGKLNLNTTSGYGSQLNILGGGNPVIIKGNPNPYISILDTSNTIEAYFGVVTSGPVFGRVGTNNMQDFAIMTNNTARILVSSTGNVIIGGVNTGRKLAVYGEQEWITPTTTGVHTTSGNHLPIWVNGVQYWLALLNPVIP
jgi:hypothetical protein